MSSLCCMVRSFGLSIEERLFWQQDGQRCRMAVNKAKCEFCAHHVKAALKNLSSGRAQLRAHTLKTSLRNAKQNLKGEPLNVVCG